MDQLDFDSGYTSADDFGFVTFQLIDEKNKPICYYMEHIRNFLV